MCPVIRVSEELFTRLESHAIGFDTPSAVIERLLDKYDGVNKDQKVDLVDIDKEYTYVKPELIFNPTNEDEFKRRLLQEKQANVVIYLSNGSIEEHKWIANKFSDSSNLRGNLWSGFLRGWKKKGIVKAELSIND